MRFPALGLFVIAAVSYCQAATVEELVKIADEVGAPFTPKSLERMNKNDLWGAKRANSSVDVVIINASDVEFRPVSHKCSNGSHSYGLSAESNLRSHTSTVVGVQSSEDNQELSCTLFYVDSQYESHFRIVLDNTLSNHNYAYTTSSKNLQARGVDGQGKNSQVRVVVTDNNNGNLSRLSQQSAIPVPQRKPKGSRNKFVKASKSGSSVRSI